MDFGDILFLPIVQGRWQTLQATGECYANSHAIKLIDYNKIWLDPTLTTNIHLDKDKEGGPRCVWLEWLEVPDTTGNVERCQGRLHVEDCGTY